jgi:hypothetical protein
VLLRPDEALLDDYAPAIAGAWSPRLDDGDILEEDDRESILRHPLIPERWVSQLRLVTNRDVVKDHRECVARRAPLELAANGVPIHRRWAITFVLCELPLLAPAEEGVPVEVVLGIPEGIRALLRRPLAIKTWWTAVTRVVLCGSSGIGISPAMHRDRESLTEPCIRRYTGHMPPACGRSVGQSR